MGRMTEKKIRNTYVVRITTQGTALLKMSCVTQHMYRFSLAISDFWSSGSLTNVNLTGIKSFTLNGNPETGHIMVGSGFCNLLTPAEGHCDGTQKLGNSFSLPLAIFEIADVLLRLATAVDDDAPASNVVIFCSVLINRCNFFCSFNALLSDSSLSSMRFWRSYSFILRLYSFFRVMMYCRIASLSNKKPFLLERLYIGMLIIIVESIRF